jgi:hypothetical protein
LESVSMSSNSSLSDRNMSQPLGLPLSQIPPAPPKKPRSRPRSAGPTIESTHTLQLQRMIPSTTLPTSGRRRPSSADSHATQGGIKVPLEEVSNKFSRRVGATAGGGDGSSVSVSRPVSASSSHGSRSSAGSRGSSRRSGQRRPSKKELFAYWKPTSTRSSSPVSVSSRGTNDKVALPLFNMCMLVDL